MKHSKQTTGFEPHKISSAINANVVVDDRLKNRTINGGYVAWPQDSRKEAPAAPPLQRAAQWLKAVKERYLTVISTTNVW